MCPTCEAPEPTSHATCPADPDAPIEPSPITLWGMTSHATESPWNPPRPDELVQLELDDPDPYDGPVEWIHEGRRLTGDEMRRVGAILADLRVRLTEHTNPRNTAYRPAGQA